MKNPQYGEIYWCNLGSVNENSGNIQKGIRPVLVVSTDFGNMVSNNTIVNVVPLTTSQQKIRNKLPCHTMISSCTCAPSVALCEQIMTIQKKKLMVDGKRIGKITDDEMNKVKNSLRSQFCC